MSFREKSAWAMLLLLMSAGSLYFQKILRLSNSLGETAPPIVPLVVAYVLFLVIGSVIIMPLIAGTAGSEANDPADERDRVILDKAGHWSGYLLGAGAIAGLFSFGVLHDGNLLFHIVFASLMVSQTAEYAFQIFLYRRGV